MAFIGASFLSGQTKESFGFVRIWVWSNQESTLAARAYKHVALEIVPEEGNETYMSFFESAHDGPSVCKKNTPHFHDDKNVDVKYFGQPNTCYVLSLNIQKIAAAYQKIVQEGLSKKNISNGVFHRPYPLNTPNIVAFLLDRGGVFNLTSYKKDHLYANVLKTVSIFGIAFGGLNCISAQFSSTMTRINSISLVYRTFEKVFKETEKIGLEIISNEENNYISMLIHSPVLISILPNTFPLSSTIAMINQSVLHSTILSKFVPPMSELTYHRIFDRINENAVDALKGQLLQVAKRSFVIAATAITLHYLINRFAFGDYTCADVERLAKIAKNVQDREAMRQQSPRDRPFRGAKIGYISFAAISLSAIVALTYRWKKG